jgi:hypothetical protein
MSKLQKGKTAVLSKTRASNRAFVNFFPLLHAGIPEGTD